jgi:hypothetical protein
MSKSTAGYMVLVAAVGMMCTLLSAEVVNLKAWAEALTPLFVGKAMAHIGVVIAAFLGGKLIPTDA